MLGHKHRIYHMSPGEKNTGHTEGSGRPDRGDDDGTNNFLPKPPGHGGFGAEHDESILHPS